MLIKFMAQESDTIQHYKFVRKTSDVLFWTFFFHNVCLAAVSLHRISVDPSFG
jgi:hypothetical protein